MLRWAIYARHSSDRQNPKSCADQITECEARIAAIGGVIVKRYADESVSGAHEAQRPQYLAMLTAMKLGTFDAVMAEDLDRYNRNLEASARLYSLAERDAVQLWTIADGRISQLHTGLKGLMGEMFLKQLSDKTRRGNLAVARDGRIPGGNCYGYRVGAGEKRGLREIDEAQAEVIRRIYADYAAGVSPRAICKALNQDGVKPPRGQEWRVSALVGTASRLNGLLVNPIYVGRPVFNRQRFIKDPETGKRIARPNPKDQWIEQHVPALQIVEREIYEAVRARRENSGRSQPLHHRRRPKTLLSGLVTCLECGSPMTVATDYFRCTAHLNAGTCENNRGVHIRRLEGWVLEGLRTAMDDDELLAQYTRHLKATLDRRQAGLSKARAAAVRRRSEIDRKIRNLLALVEDGRGSPAALVRIQQLEAERSQIQEPEAVNVIPVVTDAPQRYRRQLQHMEQLLAGEGTEAVRAREAVRSLINRIAARRQGNQIVIEADSSLGALLAFARGPESWSIARCGSPQRSMDADLAIPILRMVA